mmetsp:Transcript_24811/g.46367  ORF Transcript_24811/g.46367 Transcript_24811/m.46367 type:complete len:94 (-) Transcript_24811:606-887(-)
MYTTPRSQQALPSSPKKKTINIYAGMKGNSPLPPHTLVRFSSPPHLLLSQAAPIATVYQGAREEGNENIKKNLTCWRFRSKKKKLKNGRVVYL